MRFRIYLAVLWPFCDRRASESGQHGHKRARMSQRGPIASWPVEGTCQHCWLIKPCALCPLVRRHPCQTGLARSDISPTQAPGLHCPNCADWHAWSSLGTLCKQQTGKHGAFARACVAPAAPALRNRPALACHLEPAFDPPTPSAIACRPPAAPGMVTSTASRHMAWIGEADLLSHPIRKVSSRSRTTEFICLRFAPRFPAQRLQAVWHCILHVYVVARTPQFARSRSSAAR